MFIYKFDSIVGKNAKIWYKFYSDFLLGVRNLSVQVKPFLAEDIFLGLLSNRKIIKFMFSLDGTKLNGIVLVTNDPNKYPESHYESRYFMTSSNVRYYFLIGDLCGFAIDDSLKDRFNDDKSSFANCLQEMLLGIKSSLNEDISPVIVGNYSEKSRESLGYNFLKNNFEHLGIKQKAIDEEVFVIIEVNRFSEFLLRALKFFLKPILLFLLHYSIIYRSKSYKLIFKINNKLKLWKTNIMNSNDIHQCLNIYKARLTELVSRSPQKLLYEDDIFTSYLQDEGYIKYILEDSSGISGLFIMITKKFEDRAGWISDSSKQYDGYIKLILTRKGSLSIYFSFLFLSSIVDFFYNDVVRKGRKTVLLDYSLNINGERFNHDLRVATSNNFFELIRKNGFLNELLTKLLPFRSQILDRDIYITYELNDY